MLFFVCCSAVFGQYYYNDIITTTQTNKQFQLLQAAKVKAVSAKSFEADGSVTENFLLEQTISADGSITTVSGIPSSGQTVSTAYYKDGKIIKSENKSLNEQSTIMYTYNQNLLASITTSVTDTFMNNGMTEQHIWLYENNIPKKMWLIKNGSDSTEINFKNDANGNITDEIWKKNKQTTEHYLYYYNTKNQLTDIVRFNLKAQRLLPDFVFEYNEKGEPASLLQVPQSSDEYLTWVYAYDSRGLKTTEQCFDKRKQLVGKIEYSYR